MGADVSKLLEEYMGNAGGRAVSLSVNKEKFDSKQQRLAEKIFSHLDEDRSGFINGREKDTLARELVRVFERVAGDKLLTIFEARAMMDACDANANGKLDPDEFSSVLKSLTRRMNSSQDLQLSVPQSSISWTASTPRHNGDQFVNLQLHSDGNFALRYYQSTKGDDCEYVNEATLTGKYDVISKGNLLLRGEQITESTPQATHTKDSTLCLAGKFAWYASNKEMRNILLEFGNQIRI